MRVYVATLHAALELRRNGEKITEEWVEEQQTKYKQVKTEGGENAIVTDLDSHLGAFDEVNVEISDGTLVRVFDKSLDVLAAERTNAVRAIVSESLSACSHEDTGILRAKSSQIKTTALSVQGGRQ